MFMQVPPLSFIIFQAKNYCEEGKSIFFLVAVTFDILPVKLWDVMTLGSCSHYIELFFPYGEFAFPALMSHACSSFAIVQGKFLPSLSRPFYSLSLDLMPNHPKNPNHVFV
jgi:hypothetical protein